MSSFNSRFSGCAWFVPGLSILASYTPTIGPGFFSSMTGGGALVGSGLDSDTSGALTISGVAGGVVGCVV